MKIKIKKLLILTLTVVMILPQTVYAGWGNDNGNDNDNDNDNCYDNEKENDTDYDNEKENDKDYDNEKENENDNGYENDKHKGYENDNHKGYNKGDKKIPYGQLKKIERFSEMDSKRIRVGNKHIKFDVPPVLKGNRTLIPVRAVTEALGCDVEWAEPKAYIISPDESKILVFDLESGAVYMAEDWTYEELLAIDDQLIWDSLEVTIDVAPGLVNNRTFVPLRFIAEALGLEVGYNVVTGMIDIDETPSITPTELVVNEAALLPTTFKIEVTQNDFEFKGIKDLTEDVDYTVNADEDIVLTKSYLNGITEVTTDLVVLFTKDTVEVEESFEIKLNYLTDTPVLTPDEITFTENETDGLSYDVDMDLNGFELNEVTSSSALLIADTDYEIDDDKVTIKEAFLKALNVGVTKLSFLFSRNTEDKTVDVNINVEEAVEQSPVIAPSSMYVESTEELPATKDIDITLNGYSLKEVKDLDEDADYTLNDDLTLTLSTSYLENLEESKTVISLVFAKENEDDITLDYTIELEHLYLEPVLSPKNVTFNKADVDGLQILVDMELYGFELSKVINHNKFLAEDTDYEIDDVNNELVLKESYLSTLDIGEQTLMLMFVRDNEVAFINYELTVTE